MMLAGVVLLLYLSQAVIAYSTASSLVEATLVPRASNSTCAAQKFVVTFYTLSMRIALTDESPASWTPAYQLRNRK